MKNKNTTKNAVVPKGMITTDKLKHKAELIERLEKENNADLIRLFEMEALGYKDFAKWLKSIAKYNNTDKTMLMFSDRSADRVFVHFFTGDNKYHISAKKERTAGGGYLGAIMTTRKSRPGENWERGCDLPDGKYNKKTWDAIVNRIIAMEMKNLQCWK